MIFYFLSGEDPFTKDLEDFKEQMAAKYAITKEEHLPDQQECATSTAIVLWKVNSIAACEITSIQLHREV